MKTKTSDDIKNMKTNTDLTSVEGEVDAVPTGSAKRRRCLCDICVRIYPMHKRLKEALPESMRKDFEYLMMRMMCAEEDRDVAEAKLYGNWPGWEWMIAATAKAEAASTNDQVSHHTTKL